MRLQNLQENSSYKFIEEKLRENVVLAVIDFDNYKLKNLGESVIWVDGEESTFNKLLKKN